MGHEDKQLVPMGCVLLDEIIFTATAAINAALALDQTEEKTMIGETSASLDLLIRLPLMQYLAKSITDMFYHPTW